MRILIELQKFAQQPLASQVLLGLVSNFKRPYDKIGELVEKGYLVQIRKGLYVVGEALQVKGPESFLVANHLYGPSYVSCESALFYWGLTPERVFEVTSLTSKLSKEYSTKIGSFVFIHVPIGYYSFGMQRERLTEKQSVLIASKEKAICDKIITTSGLQLRSIKQVKDYLLDDLRIDYQELKKLNTKEIIGWLDACPKKSSIRSLINALESL